MHTLPSLLKYLREPSWPRYAHAKPFTWALKGELYDTQIKSKQAVHTRPA